VTGAAKHGDADVVVGVGVAETATAAATADGDVAADAVAVVGADHDDRRLPQGLRGLCGINDEDAQFCKKMRREARLVVTAIGIAWLAMSAPATSLGWGCGRRRRNRCWAAARTGGGMPDLR